MLANRLKKGDIIGIVAPSKLFNRDKQEELFNFINYIESIGLDVKLSENFYQVDKFCTSAGTPNQRAEDINSMFWNPDIKAIWCLQGWDTANQILDKIDYENIKRNPKIFLWKSDIDILLLSIYKKTGLITFHTCDPKIGNNKELDFEYTKYWLENRLAQWLKNIEPTIEWECIKQWKAEWKIIGCNLPTILKMAGTQYFPDFSGNIFFLEVYKSSPTELLYQLTQLQMLWVFDTISGLIIGNNHGFASWDYGVTEIVGDFLKDYSLPILKIGEFGHYQPHAFLPIWAKVLMDATNKKLEIIDDFLI